MLLNLAVDSCADDARSVGALKVASHDLVQLPVTQTLKYVDKYICGQIWKIHLGT